MKFLVSIAVFIVITTSVKSQDDDQNPVVVLDAGNVEGSVMISHELARKFYAFMSIPYAEPPTGDKRFMPPEPKEPWNGNFQADRKEVLCPQFGYSRKNDTEDCLVLNVYTPRLSNATGFLPVMVIFHEGGFLFGTGSYNFYRPEKIMDHDVVFVAPNFRLGIFGFLNTEDESSPGNYGMLDQVLVLSWVRDNIQLFCGDPGRVTIFGNSAGGSSAVFHMLSPLSQGLFHSAIAESGSALSPWAYQSHPLEWAQRMANLTNCNSTNSTSDMVSCLRNRTIDDFFNATKYSEVKYYQLYNVGPSVESSAGQGFLTDRPIDLMKQGRFNRVPFITGVVKDEGRFLTDDIIDFKEYNGQEFLEKEFCSFISYILDVEMDSNVEDLCEQARKEYFDSFDVEDPLILESCLIKVLGDMMMCTGVSQTAELFSSFGIPTQAYKFTYVTEGNNVTKNLTDHGDEITLMFDRKWSSDEVVNNTNNDRIMGDFMNFVWTEFATFQHNSIDIESPGFESVEWPMYNSAGNTSRNYLQINMNPTIESGLLCEKMDFWMKHLVAINKI